MSGTIFAEWEEHEPYIDPFRIKMQRATHCG